MYFIFVFRKFNRQFMCSTGFYRIYAQKVDFSQKSFENRNIENLKMAQMWIPKSEAATKYYTYLSVEKMYTNLTMVREHPCIT